MTTNELSIDGMSCNHCKMAVESALKSLNGVSRADVDLEANKVSVDFDDNSLNIPDLIKVIEEAGYKVNK